MSYKAYFLEDLVQQVTSEHWRARVQEKDLDEASNRVKFAKVLFYVGEFQYGILELLRAQRHVEATVIASALKELSLLATKQSIYETVRD